MNNHSIGFIGGGNMATALIGGLIADGTPTTAIRVSEPDAGRRQQLTNQFQITTCDDNSRLAAECDILVLAVKPQRLQAVTEPMATAIQQHRPLLISIAAGIRMADIERWAGGTIPLVRTMPNTPALVQSGATALYASGQVSPKQREQAEGIMRAVGIAIWLDEESQMDAVTALSGSGPAYFFLTIEALEQAGEQLGLPRETARLLALQTAFGASKMALESPEECAQLRQRVTSPGGTTEAAINVLEQQGLRDAYLEALTAATLRAAELADMFGGEVDG